MNICVYGASREEIAESYKESAWKLGRLIAQKGWNIVYGGGATGLMGALARGFDSVDDHEKELIGVSPRFFDKPGVLYENCTKMHWTETMRERKQLMEDLSDAFVVMPGGYGTFDEFFEILTLRQLGRHNKPILLLNHDGYYESVRQLIKKGYEVGFVYPDKLNICDFIDTPEEICACLEVESARLLAENENL